MQPKVGLYTVTVAFIPSFTLSFIKLVIEHLLCTGALHPCGGAGKTKSSVSVSRDREGQQCRLRVNDSNNVIYGVKVRGSQDPQEVEVPIGWGHC